jgi:hypothetical protein
MKIIGNHISGNQMPEITKITVKGSEIEIHKVGEKNEEVISIPISKNVNTLLIEVINSVYGVNNIELYDGNNLIERW